MDFRMFFKKDGKQISPWHDIPLSAGSGKYHFVCEIPKESDAKMECAIVRCRRPDYRRRPKSAVVAVWAEANAATVPMRPPRGWLQDEASNPIKQDTKKGKLRFYPYNINWNYGFLPQTWEDPAHKNDECGGVFGDNDPVDVVEISSTALPMGSVHAVKCVGTYAMIDDGELDWKVIAIRADDPIADKINDVEDVERCVLLPSYCHGPLHTHSRHPVSSP